MSNDTHNTLPDTTEFHQCMMRAVLVITRAKGKRVKVWLSGGSSGWYISDSGAVLVGEFTWDYSIYIVGERLAAALKEAHSAGSGSGKPGTQLET